MPKLGTGQATLVVARVKAAQRANGRARGELFAIETVRPQHAVEGATTSGGALARRWARSRLDELIAGYAKPAAIAAHAMQYGLVSPYTSMVAIGTEVTVTGGVKHSVSVPVSVPAGMRWQPVKRETTVATIEPTPQPPPVTVTQDYHRNVPTGRTLDDKPRSKDNKNAEPPPKPAPVKERPAAKAPPADTGDDAPAKKSKKHLGDDDDAEPDSKADKAKDGRDEDEARATRHHKPHKTGANDNENAGEATGAAPSPTTPIATKSDTAEYADEITVDATSMAPLRSRYRLSLQLGGGVAFHGGAGGLGALSGRFEIGGRTLVGIDSSLWLVGDKLTLEGQLLAGVSRRGIARYLELGAGVGVHLGDGVGPAASLRMRSIVPPLGRHVGLFLRYDAALLYNRGAREGDNALTLGLDWLF
jgi:hypothetical protein